MPGQPGVSVERPARPMVVAHRGASVEQPENTVEFDRGPDGAVKGARVMPGNKQRLQNKAPITDNFAPQRRALPGRR